MRIKSTFTIEIEGPDNSISTIEFRKPLANAALKQEVAAADSDASKGKIFADMVLDSVVSCSGFFKEDGTEMSVAELKACEDPVILSYLLHGYAAGITRPISAEEIQKKITVKN
jgi:hypothetical protein